MAFSRDFILSSGFLDILVVSPTRIDFPRVFCWSFRVGPPILDLFELAKAFTYFLVCSIACMMSLHCMWLIFEIPGPCKHSLIISFKRIYALSLEHLLLSQYSCLSSA